MGRYNACLTDQRRAQAEGRLQIHTRIASRFLASPRDLIVYLPPGYAQSDDRYPVLYLQDGQNLFDPATAFAGQDWGADRTADEMISKQEVQAMLIVGIYNTGRHRISEYAPSRDRVHRKGGKALRYAQMLAREIKPMIDRQYRTLKRPEATAVGGSSLGALVSLVSALAYPRVFGQVALMSPSVWWDDRAILDSVRRFNNSVRPRVWLDAGTNEGSSPHQLIEDSRHLRDVFVDKGWQEGLDLSYHEIPDADHSERAWGARFGAVLSYLFPFTS